MYIFDGIGFPYCAYDIVLTAFGNVDHCENHWKEKKSGKSTMTKLKIAQENDRRLYKDDSVYVHVKGVVRPFEFFLASIARTIISNTTSVTL